VNAAGAFVGPEREMKDNGCRVQEPAANSRTRYFSVDEANRALVLVRRIVADIVGGYRRLMDLQEALEAMQSQPRPACEEVRAELIGMVERLQDCLAELEEVGVELKDWAIGLVDFPCLWHGRAVNLSWQHGEPRVSFWHEAGDGAATRMPLANLLLEEMAVAK